MKRRDSDPWMPAAAYARTLSGLTVNLLVRDIDASLVFQREVLAARVVYSDPDFAALEGYGARWSLHADHTYNDHPMHGVVAAAEVRGLGVELRLHGRDPDAAQAAARRLGFVVLDAATDKAHGLREAYLVDADGYVWIADVPL